MPHRVVVLALDRVVPFDLGIPARVFGAALDADGKRLYDVGQDRPFSPDLLALVAFEAGSSSP